MVIVDKEYDEEDEKDITFLLKLISKEITNLGNAKLSMPFFLANNFFISSDILIPTHALTAETLTGSPTTVGTDITESKCSEEIVDEKEKGEDE